MTKTTPYIVKDFSSTIKINRQNQKWDTNEPKKEERIQLYQKCPTCILVPPIQNENKQDPKNYKFPICTKLQKSDNKCQMNCKGVLAANRRARLTKIYPKVVQLTSQLLNKYTCTKKAQTQKLKKEKLKDTDKEKQKLKKKELKEKEKLREKQKKLKEKELKEKEKLKEKQKKLKEKELKEKEKLREKQKKLKEKELKKK